MCCHFRFRSALPLVHFSSDSISPWRTGVFLCGVEICVWGGKENIKGEEGCWIERCEGRKGERKSFPPPPRNPTCSLRDSLISNFPNSPISNLISTHPESRGSLIKRLLMRGVLRVTRFGGIFPGVVKFISTALAFSPGVDDQIEKQRKHAKRRVAGLCGFRCLSFFSLVLIFSARRRKVGDGIIVRGGLILTKGKSKGNGARFAKLLSFLLLPFLSGSHFRGKSNETESGS